MQPEIIKQWIESGLPQSTVFVEGDGSHFTATVISSEFLNKTRIQRQRLVYDTINIQLADGTIHAISLKTFTPQEWQEAKR